MLFCFFVVAACDDAVDDATGSAGGATSCSRFETSASIMASSGTTRSSASTPRTRRSSSPTTRARRRRPSLSRSHTRARPSFPTPGSSAPGWAATSRRRTIGCSGAGQIRRSGSD